jgi:hypothetical protein
MKFFFVYISSELSALTTRCFASFEKLHNTVIECLLLWHTNKEGILVTFHVIVDDRDREGIQNFDSELNFDACDFMRLVVHLFDIKA